MKYLLDVKSLEIIWSSFLLLIFIKNAIKSAITVVISLYMLSLENPENQYSETAANTREAGPWMKLPLFNLRLINNVTIKLIRVFRWKKKTTCLPLLIAFSSLYDINTTLKICITITWSFTLRYVIATTSLWCWKKISHNDVTSISIRNRSISWCKSNKNPMSLQYGVPTG